MSCHVQAHGASSHSPTSMCVCVCICLPLCLLPDTQASKNSAKAMFGKDELAAILRFGAEDLFKNSGGAPVGPPGQGEESVEVG